MANEGGFIYGQDDNEHAKPSRDKVIGNVELHTGQGQENADNCNVKENVEYSDRVKGETCED